SSLPFQSIEDDLLCREPCKAFGRTQPSSGVSCKRASRASKRRATIFANLTIGALGCHASREALRLAIKQATNAKGSVASKQTAKDHCLGEHPDGDVRHESKDSYSRIDACVTACVNPFLVFQRLLNLGAAFAQAACEPSVGHSKALGHSNALP